MGSSIFKILKTKQSDTLMSMSHHVALTSFNILLSLLQVFSVPQERTKAIQIQLGLFLKSITTWLSSSLISKAATIMDVIFILHVYLLYLNQTLYIYHIINILYIYEPAFCGFYPHYVFQRFSISLHII